MEFNEIIEALKGFEGTDDYSNFTAGFINDDSVNAYLESDSGKKLMQPKLDSYFSKGLESLKANNLDTIVSAKVKELYPDADPKDVEIADLKAKIAEQERAATVAALTNTALKYAHDNNLPDSIIPYFIGKDEDETNKNLETLKKEFTAAVGSAVDSKLKGGSYTPPDDDSEPLDGVTARFLANNPGMKITDIT